MLDLYSFDLQIKISWNKLQVSIPFYKTQFEAKMVDVFDVFMDVTYYPQVSEKIDKIHDTLKAHGVRYKIWPERTEFKKRANPNGNSDPQKTWDYCRERSCITISDGEIATCYLQLIIDYFNKHFGTQIDMSSSVIDLYDPKLTGVDLVNKLTHYQDACRYCHDDVSVPGSRYASPAEAKIENWV